MPICALCVFTTVCASHVLKFEVSIVDVSGPRTPLASCPTTSWRTSPSTPLQPQSLEVHHRQTGHASSSNAEPGCSFAICCNVNRSYWVLVYTVELVSCACEKCYCVITTLHYIHDIISSRTQCKVTMLSTYVQQIGCCGCQNTKSNIIASTAE